MTQENLAETSAVTPPISGVKAAERKGHPRIEKVKAIVGAGLGIGGCLGFSLAFAANGSWPLAVGMLIFGGLGGYASNINLESVYNKDQ